MHRTGNLRIMQEQVALLKEINELRKEHSALRNERARANGGAGAGAGGPGAGHVVQDALVVDPASTGGEVLQ